IAEVASAAANRSEYLGIEFNEGQAPDYAPPERNIGCTIRSLPKRLLVKAAETAVRINPVNAPALGPLASVAADLVLEPQHIAVLTSKYWGPTPRQLTVSFLESTPSDLRARIISHMNAWTRTE